MTFVLLTKSNTPILREIATLFGWILEGIYNMLSQIGITNVGVCIILLTFIVNALMIPITIKQQKFTRLSAKMNPELTKIQAKYKGKKDSDSIQKMQAEQQAIYRKYGASPTGGCLPLLITFPILIALYRVIYNIPAYVPAINEIYMGLVNAIKDYPDFASILSQFVKGTGNAMENAVTVTSLGKLDVVEAITNDVNAKNYIIDILSQFKMEHWDALKANFSNISGAVGDTQMRLAQVNSFLGMNITENPSYRNLTVLVPVLAVVTQFIQNKLSMVKQKSNKDDANSMNASMNAMNNVMPIMSGIFCLMFPIGVGLYWVAGNVFRIIQTFFINRYLEKIDVEVLVERNDEKMKKRIERRGTHTNSSLRDYAKKKTSSISVSNNPKEDLDKDSEGSKSEVKKGSISEYANMLSKKRNDKPN